MRALIQRVSQAAVDVQGERIAAIGPGILALIGVQAGDGEAEATRLVERLLTYRIFADAEGRMNLSVADIRGGVLLVPQFTLAADTRKGTRPGFSTAAAPERAKSLFDALVVTARSHHHDVQAGRFGAHMQVTLTNDGPVTFLLETGERQSSASR
jgi:D-tyrosyl-tRNA(Tyr) deacylase